MSASNWAICPRCRRAEEARIADLQDDARVAYGVVPSDEYEAMRAMAAVPINLHALQTLREDYEIWGAETGTVNVSYGGHCQECGLGLDFKFTREFPEVLT